MSIKSRPANENYRDNWTKIFGRRGKPKLLNDLSPAAIRAAANSKWEREGFADTVERAEIPDTDSEIS